MTEDWLLDDPISSLPKEPCSVCGKPLSKYNKTGRCFHHPDPKEIERAERRAQKRKELDLLEQGVQEVLSNVEAVIRFVCEDCNVTREQLFEKNRKSTIVLARHILMYLLYNDVFHSYPKTGEILGGRDHTTVIHGVKKITKLIADNDVIVKKHINRIRARYQGAATN